MRWKCAYSIQKSPYPPVAELVLNVNTSYMQYDSCITDAENRRYVQIAEFTDPSENEAASKYLMIVNRRVEGTESRKIDITLREATFSAYNNWLVTDLETGEHWSVFKNGTFSALYQPGCGRLFHIEPVALAGKGTFLVNETLSAPISVKSTDTLKVNPGVTLTAPYTITVNGTMRIEGAGTNKAAVNFNIANGASGLIKVYGKLTLRNAILKNAATGVRVEYNGMLDAQNTLFTDNLQPVYLLPGSKAVIDFCTFANTTYASLYTRSKNYLITNTSFRSGTEGIFAYNTNLDLTQQTIPAKIGNVTFDCITTGISFRSSRADVYQSTFDSCQTGVKCDFSSSPLFGNGTAYGYNDFTKNQRAVHVLQNSNPVIGIFTMQRGENGTRNDFSSDNTMFIRAENTSYAAAQLCYWDTVPPPPAKFTALTGSTIVYTPYLTQPADGRVMNDGIAPEEMTAVSEETGTVQPAGTVSPAWGQPEGGMLEGGTAGTLQEQVTEGVQNYLNGLLDEASSIVANVLFTYPDSQAAYRALDLLWLTEQERNPRGFITQIQSNSLSL